MRSDEVVGISKDSFMSLVIVGQGHCTVNLKANQENPTNICGHGKSLLPEPKASEKREYPFQHDRGSQECCLFCWTCHRFQQGTKTIFVNRLTSWSESHAKRQDLFLFLSSPNLRHIWTSPNKTPHLACRGSWPTRCSSLIIAVPPLRTKTKKPYLPALSYVLFWNTK